jgi:hypothetical protein
MRKLYKILEYGFSNMSIRHGYQVRRYLGGCSPSGICNSKGISKNIIKDVDLGLGKDPVKGATTNHLVEKENIIKGTTGYSEKYLGGFTSYKDILLLNNFIFTFNPESNSVTLDRDTLLFSVREFLSKLDVTLTYSVLFLVQSSDGENINHTISKSSILIHNEFSESALTEILLNDINRYLDTYASHNCESVVNFNLLAQFKIWVSEEEYGKAKFMEIKRLIVDAGLKRLKLLTSLNTINSDDDVILKGLKNMKFYDFNLSYNHLFEKEIFFSSLGGQNKAINNNNNLHLNIQDIIKLYSEFLKLLTNNKEVVYFLDDKYNENFNDNNKLKIMFRSINRGDKEKDMVNN